MLASMTNQNFHGK